MNVEQDMFLLDCHTYEDYLNSFITANDLRNLRNIRYCRMLVELGYRTTSGIYTKEQFEQRKAAVADALHSTKKATIWFSDGMTSVDPVLRELAAREQPNQQKIISTIIFLKTRLKNGFEISGYKDYEQSLRRANLAVEGHTDWVAVFSERAMLRPKTGDLSFCSWHKGIVVHNDSDNYRVLHTVKHGLVFMHKGDHKKINVDLTMEKYNKNCTRSMYYSEKYGHVVLYDHIIRKKI